MKIKQQERNPDNMIQSFRKVEHDAREKDVNSEYAKVLRILQRQKQKDLDSPHNDRYSKRGIPHVL